MSILWTACETIILTIACIIPFMGQVTLVQSKVDRLFLDLLVLPSYMFNIIFYNVNIDDYTRKRVHLHFIERALLFTKGWHHYVTT